MNLKIASFGRFESENKSKTHPAAANTSKSIAVSSSIINTSEEHQIDKNSACGTIKIAIRASVCEEIYNVIKKVKTLFIYGAMKMTAGIKLTCISINKTRLVVNLPPPTSKNYDLRKFK